MSVAPCTQTHDPELCFVHAVMWLTVPDTYKICSMPKLFHTLMCISPSDINANLLQISLVEMPSFSFNIHVYGGDITFLPGVEKWINWFIETRVLRPYVLPERLTVPVKFLYDPTLEVTHCCCSTIHVSQVALCIRCKVDSGQCCCCYCHCYLFTCIITLSLLSLSFYHHCF